MHILTLHLDLTYPNIAQLPAGPTTTLITRIP